MGVVSAIVFSHRASADLNSSQNALSLNMSGDRYLTSTSVANHGDAYSTFGIDYNLRHEQKNWETIIQALGEFHLDQSKEHYFTIPQAYFGWTTDSHFFHLGLGRKLEDWSVLDREWKLGLWQPRLLADPIRPQEQGFIGLFNQLEVEDWQLTLFASPLFLPDQGPQFNLVDGRFESGNRWFLPPQDRIEVFHQESQIDYRLDKPNDRDVVLNSSWALRLRHGRLNSGFWWQWSMTRQPMNQIHLGVEGYQSLALTESLDKATAVIHARIVYHQVNSMEVGQTWDRAKLWLSLSEEIPDQPRMDVSWKQAPLFESRIYGIHLAHDLPLPYLPNSHFSLSYLQIEEKTPRWVNSSQTDEGQSSSHSLAGEKVTESLPRFPVEQALKLQWEAQLWDSFKQRLGWTTQYIYSFPDRAALLSLQVQWGSSPELTWNAGVDILGATPSRSGEVLEKSIYSRFRQNDRIAGGLTYVF